MAAASLSSSPSTKPVATALVASIASSIEPETSTAGTTDSGGSGASPVSGRRSTSRLRTRWSSAAWPVTGIPSLATVAKRCVCRWAAASPSAIATSARSASTRGAASWAQTGASMNAGIGAARLVANLPAGRARRVAPPARPHEPGVVAGAGAR